MAKTQNLSEGLPSKPSRPVYVYDVPTTLGEGGIETVGLVQLTAREEMMAAKRAGSDAIKLVYEQVKQALVEVNGEKVGLADGSADTAFDKMNPMVRNLVMTAFAQLHTPPEEATVGFLQSRIVRVA